MRSQGRAVRAEICFFPVIFRIAIGNSETLIEKRQIEKGKVLPLQRAGGQLHVEFIPRIAKVLIIWKNAYARIALSQSMVPTTHS